MGGLLTRLLGRSRLRQGREEKGQVLDLLRSKDFDRELPRHVAIIMDGNGRWARERHLPRQAGHRAGAENLRQICEVAARAGLSYLTVYAFSTENWKRPAAEVETLMGLFLEFLERYDAELEANGVRLRFMGERSRLSPRIQEALGAAEARSEQRKGLQLILAFNYGGRDELLRAVKRASRELGAQGLEHLDEAGLARYLDLPDVPDPELIIRTSGELRLSNFLLWQAAYSEFYITGRYWPDFHEEDLAAALEAYGRRERRFGGLK